MATPTYATALSQINTFIVANGNNEITANVLNPILKIILDFANNNIGDLTTLTTDETNTIVEAINSLKQNFEDLINNGVQLHTGYDNPNVTPPADYNYGDFYMQLDSGDDSPIQLWQWNGFEWKDSSSNPATNSDNVENNSDVDGVTVTEALNNLLNSLPNEYTKVVYVDNNNPNSATIFDLNNPPTVNDNLLKSDVNNLYIGLDASTWVYNATSLNYVTKTISSNTSNFYLSGTTTDAGNSKTASIVRSGRIGIGENPVDTNVRRLKIGDRPASDQMNVSAISENIDITGNTSMSGLNVEILGNGLADSNGRASRAIKGFGLIDPKGFNMSNVGGGAMGVEGVARILAGATGTVNVITGLYGRVLGDSNEAGIIVNFGNGLVIPPPANLSSTKWGRAIGVNINAQNTNTPALQHIDLLIGNGNANGTSAPGLPSAKDYGILNWSLSDSYFRSRFSIGTTAFLGDEKFRVLGTVVASPAVTSNEVVVKSQLDLKADITALPTSGTYVPVSSNPTNISAVTFDEANYTKIGNIVSVSVVLRITPTAASTNTNFEITIPISRGVAPIAAIMVGNGIAIDTSGTPFYGVSVETVANTTTVFVKYYPTATGLKKARITFQYSI